MKQGIYKVTENKQLTPTVYRMKLAGDVSAITVPGQFVNIKLDGHYLRRPISVCNAEIDDPKTGEGTFTIIYKVLGHGTEDMTQFGSGRELDVLTGLGYGFDISKAGNFPLLIGGGVGIPPLYFTAKMMESFGSAPIVILGFNSKEEMFLVQEFIALKCSIIIATADGSVGVKGTVVDAFKELMKLPGAAISQFYACGPEAMLRAVYGAAYIEAGIPGQMSFEERMGCGFGACMGCSIETRDGLKRVCKDGPVFKTEEILW